MKKLFTILLILISCISHANTIVLQPTAKNEIYYPHGGISKADTIQIAPGNYVSIILTGIFGNGNKVVIDGTNVHADFIRIDSSAWFKLQGFDAGVLNAGAGIAIELCSHYEVFNCTIHDSQVGLYCKKNPTPDPLTQYPNYVITDVKIYGNYIHRTHGEGMYIGHTYPLADPYDGNLPPVRMSGVQIFNNRVDSTDWDGIQLSNATDNCSIHDNLVTNYGLIDLGDQRAGIILGSNTNGDVYNNVVDRGTGNCIQIFGYGDINVYNNSIRGGTTIDGTEQSIFTKSTVTIEQRPKQTIHLFNNTIREPQIKGILQANNDLGMCDSTVFQRNMIVFKDSIPANWQGMISSAAPNKLLTPNTVSLESVIVLPVDFEGVEAHYLNDKQIQVSFTSELQVKEFFIEISQDGIHFKKVKVIVPNGKTYTEIIDL